MTINQALYSSKSDEWETPDDFFKGMQAYFGDFNFDLAAQANNNKCSFYTASAEELTFNPNDPIWPRKVWCNPPYSKHGRTVVLESLMKGLSNLCFTDAVCLLAFRPDTNWFFKYVWQQSCRIYLVKGRITFKGAKSGAPFPSAVVEYPLNAPVKSYIAGCFTNKGEFFNI